MTAVIGILNKEGAAIAADSAVTVSNYRGEKILNSANKMIRLSEVAPIGVMICSNAYLMCTPWDLIIRWYRTKRGTLEFPTMRDYITDFVKFLEKSKFFCKEEQETNYMDHMLDNFFSQVENEATYLEYDDEMEPKNLDEVVESYRVAIDKRIQQYQKAGQCPRFRRYSFEKFASKYSEVVEKYFGLCYNDVLAEQIKGMALEGFYWFITHQEPEVGNCTALVFTGYGMADEYPSLVSVRVILGFDGHLAYYISPEDIKVISDEEPYGVMPFAQTDVMQNLINGMNPILTHSMFRHADDSFSSLRGNIGFEASIEYDVPQEIIDVMDEVSYDDILADFKKDVRKIIDGPRKSEIYDKIKDLSVEEMAKLADCMVSITAIKRHINFDQEGVGGLVDLATITKKDGFKWLNRKCWYDAPGTDGFNI